VLNFFKTATLENCVFSLIRFSVLPYRINYLSILIIYFNSKDNQDDEVTRLVTHIVKNFTRSMGILFSLSDVPPDKHDNEMWIWQ